MSNRLFPILPLTTGFDLNNALFGLYFTTSSAIVYSLINKPVDWGQGEISLFSFCNTYIGI